MATKKRSKSSSSKRKQRSEPNDPLAGLTGKQRRFVLAYRGNATEAARIAGYSAASVEGHRLLRNPKVRKAIAQREIITTRQHIATREERQAFWTQVMADPAEDLKHRLKASELLGKSQADFLERRQVEHSGGLLVRWAQPGEDGLFPDPSQEGGD